ncbi:MAG: hypothetical protein HC905_00695 [Bacteroidales bacterium]|nr:hypothetical protein [Bacteroidales bacterium]
MNSQAGDDIFSFRKMKMKVKIKVIDELTGDPISFTNLSFSDSLLVTESLKTDNEGFAEIIVPINDSLEFFLTVENNLPIKVNYNEYRETEPVLVQTKDLLKENKTKIFRKQWFQRTEKYHIQSSDNGKPETCSQKRIKTQVQRPFAY